MGLPPGVDRYILFAADAKFAGGVLLHSAREPNIADRVVHPFWSDIRFDPSQVFKKTLPVETVARDAGEKRQEPPVFHGRLGG